MLPGVRGWIYVPACSFASACPHEPKVGALVSQMVIHVTDNTRQLLIMQADRDRLAVVAVQGQKFVAQVRAVVPRGSLAHITKNLILTILARAPFT